MSVGRVGLNGLPVRVRVTEALPNNYAAVIHQADAEANRYDIRYVTCR